MLKQHVNQVAAHFGFELWAGIYDTMTAALHAGGELLHQPYSVVATHLDSMATYSEVPHGLQPNGSSSLHRFLVHPVALMIRSQLARRWSGRFLIIPMPLSIIW